MSSSEVVEDQRKAGPSCEPRSWDMCEASVGCDATVKEQKYKGNDDYDGDR